MATVNGIAYGYDANGNMSTRNGFTTTWSSANLPTSLSATGVSATFSYGPDRQRKQQTAVYNSEGTNGTESTIYVVGLMEIETTPTQTHYKHWLSVPGGTQIVYDLLSAGAQTTYITADHLGSGNLLLDSTGAVLIKESYAAYGYRRTFDWSAPLPATSSQYTTIASTTRRGYTEAFHELIDNLGLIHMNGRMYDSVIGRFLSPDPVGGVVGDSQSLNPYSYVDNSPLTYSDPSGYDCSNGGTITTEDVSPPSPASPTLVGFTDQTPRGKGGGGGGTPCGGFTDNGGRGNTYTNPGNPTEPPGHEPSRERERQHLPQIKLPCLAARYSNFFSQQYSAALPIANQYGVDVSLLLSVSAWESGYGTSSMYANQNNPTGQTPGGFSTPGLTYPSFTAAWNGWGNRWGPAVRNVGGDVNAFVSNLAAAGYNTGNAATGGDLNWAPGITSVAPSVQSRLNQWLGGAPTCGSQ